MITKTFYIASGDWRYEPNTRAYKNTFQAVQVWPKLTSDYYNEGLIIFYCLNAYSKGGQANVYDLLPYTFWPSNDNSFFRRFMADAGVDDFNGQYSPTSISFISYDSNNYPVNPGYAVFKGVAIKNIPDVARMSPEQKDIIARQYLKKINN